MLMIRVALEVTERKGGGKLIRTDKLRGIIAERGMAQSDVAAIIGITPKTFYEKMKAGVFGSDEIEKMIDSLQIERPMDIFFAKDVT